MNQEILSISGFNGFNAARSALLRRFLLALALALALGFLRLLILGLLLRDDVFQGLVKLRPERKKRILAIDKL